MAYVLVWSHSVALHSVDLLLPVFIELHMEEKELSFTLNYGFIIKMHFSATAVAQCKVPFNFMYIQVSFCDLHPFIPSCLLMVASGEGW